MGDASQSNGSREQAAATGDDDILELDASFLGDAAVFYGDDDEEDDEDISEEVSLDLLSSCCEYSQKTTPN